MIKTLSKPALSAIFATIIATMGYFGNFSGVDAKTLNNKYVKKGEASFDDLSTSVKKRYYSEKKKCQNQKPVLANSDIINKCEPTNELKAQKVTSFEPKTTLKSKKNNFVSQISCSNMGVNEYKIDNVCRTKLYDFFKTIDSKEYKFEIIPLVDNHDFKILKQIKQNPELCNNLETKINATQMSNLFSLANAGLGVYRIKEARWLLRQRFGKNIDVKFTPYTINTKYERGFLIRLYN